MKVTFHIHEGLAGDPQALLVGTAEDGKFNRLFTKRNLLSLKFAKWLILREFEKETGRKHVEHI